jgi:hypothetical protein
MGRLKKYNTEEEKQAAQQKWVREYYYRNKESLNKRQMEKYYELRKNIQSDNRESKV